MNEKGQQLRDDIPICLQASVEVIWIDRGLYKTKINCKRKYD